MKSGRIVGTGAYLKRQGMRLCSLAKDQPIRNNLAQSYLAAFLADVPCMRQEIDCKLQSNSR